MAGIGQVPSPPPTWIKTRRTKANPRFSPATHSVFSSDASPQTHHVDRASCPLATTPTTARLIALNGFGAANLSSQSFWSRDKTHVFPASSRLAVRQHSSPMAGGTNGDGDGNVALQELVPSCERLGRSFFGAACSACWHSRAAARRGGRRLQKRCALAKD